MSNIDKHAELRKELSNPATGSNHHLRKLALELLDDLEVKEEQRANWFQMAEKLGADLDVAKRRIAELEAREAKTVWSDIDMSDAECFTITRLHEIIYASALKWPEPKLLARFMLDVKQHAGTTKGD